MADIKISAMTAASGLTGAELVAGVQSGISVNITAANMLVQTQGTVTANSPMLNLSQTWNNAAVTFKGAVITITNTASASYSVAGKPVTVTLTNKGAAVHNFHVVGLAGADEGEVGAERQFQQPGLAVDLHGPLAALHQGAEPGPREHAAEAVPPGADPLGERPLGHELDLDRAVDHLPLGLGVGPDVRRDQPPYQTRRDQPADAGARERSVVGDDREAASADRDQPVD